MHKGTNTIHNRVENGGKTVNNRRKENQKKHLPTPTIPLYDLENEQSQ